MTERAVYVIEPLPFAHHLRRSIGSDGRSGRRILVAEREGFGSRRAADHERKDPPIARLRRPPARVVVQSNRSAPPREYGHILNAIDLVSYRRRHDAGARIERPELLAVGSAIGGQDSVRASLNNQVAARGQDASAFGYRILRAPGFLLLHGIPRQEFSDRWRQSSKLGVERAIVPVVSTYVVCTGIIFPFCVWCMQFLCTLFRRQIDQAGRRAERHRIPVMRAIRLRRNDHWLQACKRGLR